MRITGNILAVTSMVLSTGLTGFMYERQISNNRKSIELEKKLQQNVEIYQSKKLAYARFLSSFEEGRDATIGNDDARQRNAEIAINRSIAMVDILSPKDIYTETSKVMEYLYLKDEDSEKRNVYIDNLITLMRKDLETSDPLYLLEETKESN